MGFLVEVPAGARAFRYFLTYTGVGLPLRLVEPIEGDQVSNRNTYIRAWFDDEERLAGFDKLVYGEVELAHRYAYDSQGKLMSAEITFSDEETVNLRF